MSAGILWEVISKTLAACCILQVSPSRPNVRNYILEQSRDRVFMNTTISLDEFIWMDFII